MRVPDHVRDEVRRTVWRRADDLGWLDLRPASKSKLYENWSRDPAIGGVLLRFLDSERVRVYLKDTILKGYGRSKGGDARGPLLALGIDPNAPVTRKFAKPHGLLFSDSRLVSWGRADDWKVIVTSTFERVFAIEGATAVGVVLVQASRGFGDAKPRLVVEAAARRLGIARVIWIP